MVVDAVDAAAAVRPLTAYSILEVAASRRVSASLRRVGQTMDTTVLATDPVPISEMTFDFIVVKKVAEFDNETHWALLATSKVNVPFTL